MEKLKIKHLGRRLAYKPHVQWVRSEDKETVTVELTISDYDFLVRRNNCKPIFHPLSDLTKPIVHKGCTFIPSEVLFAMDKLKTGHTWNYYAINSDNIKLLNFEIVEMLLSWNFVLDEPEGTWIDVNTLETNPYQ